MYAAIFEGDAKKVLKAHFHFVNAQGMVILGSPRARSTGKYLKNYIQIYAILVLFKTTFKVNFV